MAIGLSDSATHAVAGAAGGCIAMAITYPLVNLSTRSQSTRAAALKIIQRDGVVGLYDGLSSSLLGIAVTNGFEEARAIVLKSRQSGKATISTFESILVSAFAGQSFSPFPFPNIELIPSVPVGAATSIMSNPIWVVNTRQTVRTTVATESSLPMSTSKEIVEKLSGKLFCTSFAPMARPLSSTVSDPPSSSSRRANSPNPRRLFEQLKNFILRRRALRLTKAHASAPPLTDLDFFLLGAVTKLFATGITYPYLTVKARMQAGNAEGKSYNSSFDGLRKIISQDGVQGLYRGVGPKLTQSVATAAILFLAKEKIYNATKKVRLSSSHPSVVCTATYCLNH
ncbi:SPOSA6832_00787 [Sporobolomyces salmonicolor]|uniref:SPOSA6832_00787-mRNA-1:cds n=1 Tax=Sporidiobolus salmonicolor TaxID=5005 RepID=A0A0D6EHN5_SPOSA|nr:SPOSA6832_00787 [Sporobolomyces salmonicolor]